MAGVLGRRLSSTNSSFFSMDVPLPLLVCQRLVFYRKCSTSRLHHPDSKQQLRSVHLAQSSSSSTRAHPANTCDSKAIPTSKAPNKHPLTLAKHSMYGIYAAPLTSTSTAPIYVVLCHTWSVWFTLTYTDFVGIWNGPSWIEQRTSTEQLARLRHPMTPMNTWRRGQPWGFFWKASLKFHHPMLDAFLT